MRRLLVVALVALSACVPTPRQLQRWLDWHERAPRRAETWARHHFATAPEHRQLDWRPSTACSQWAQTALDAGWTKAQWYEPIARIMYAESRCNPHAYNGASGVAGLMQIHPLWRADAQCDVELYDPLANLRCARHVYAVQGWHAWVTY